MYLYFGWADGDDVHARETDGIAILPRKRLEGFLWYK
jgi:hypothetical protein